MSDAALLPVPPERVEAALRRAGRSNPLLEFAPFEGGTPADRLDVDPLLAAVTGWLSLKERRVAASLVVLGYSARLVGPSLALLLADGLLVDVNPARMRCAYAPETGFRLALDAPAAWAGPPAALLTQWSAAVVQHHLKPLIALVRARARVSERLLWGNVASGLVGTLRALHDRVPAEHAYAAGRALLDTGPLRGSGTLTLAVGQVTFRRTSCCLYYRIPGAGTCGDCCLNKGV
jgi:siderophore-iron reductase FhuF